MACEDANSKLVEVVTVADFDSKKYHQGSFLTCEDANSKLVEVVTVADVDDEDRVANSLKIWKLRFGQKASLLFSLSAQGLVRSLRFKFRRDFEADVWSVFCC